MKRISHFAPGEHGDGDDLVPRLRFPVPVGTADAYVTAYTEPDEAVLVPYCQSASLVTEILDANRRVLAANFDPLIVFFVQECLTPLPERELDAALARLGDSLKEGIPLRSYLTEQYATTCPACGRSAIADFFVWDRDRGVPVDKYVRCSGCPWDGLDAVNSEDLDNVGAFPERGLHYHFVLDRTAPISLGAPERGRVESLLELYTHRNLYALAELTLRIERLFPEGAQQHALKLLLLDCLDRCSSLSPVRARQVMPGEVRPRLRLVPPDRVLERNVWLALEEAAGRLQKRIHPLDIAPVSSLDRFDSEVEAVRAFVGERRVRDLARSLSPRSIRLILFSPPPLDSAVWSLSYFWGAWLHGAEAAAPLRSLLRQRTPDAVWFARVMHGSLRHLAGLLKDEGRLVMVLSGQRQPVVEALLLAAGAARMGVASLTQSGADYRLELTPTLSQPGNDWPIPSGTVPATSLRDQIRETSLSAAIRAIEARGEPVPFSVLHAAIYSHLARRGLFADLLDTDDAVPFPLPLIREQIEDALEDEALVSFDNGGAGEKLWWLAETSTVEPPLSDRLELATYHVLQEHLLLTELDFARLLYARFPGNLTPRATLVATLLRAYGHEASPGYWQLRSEDLPQARAAEREDIIEALQALGRRLGHSPAQLERFDVAWFEGEQPRAAFVVRWQADLYETLPLGQSASGAHPYLVIPGGRSALVTHKLAHNPLLAQQATDGDWRFIKYRHVRQLTDQDEIDEYALQTIIGLDPMVEKESAQLSLF